MIPQKISEFETLEHFYGPILELPRSVTSDAVGAFLLPERYFAVPSGDKAHRFVRFSAHLEVLYIPEIDYSVNGLVYSTSIEGGIKAGVFDCLRTVGNKQARKCTNFDDMNPSDLPPDMLVRLRDELTDLFDNILDVSERFRDKFGAFVTDKRNDARPYFEGTMEGASQQVYMDVEGNIIPRPYPRSITEEVPSEPHRRGESKVSYLRLATVNGASIGDGPV